MQRISLILIPGLIAIILYVGISNIDSVTIQSDPEISSTNLNYDGYAEGINTILYDEFGTINYTLQANKQVHYNDNTISLDQPLIRLFQDGNARWNIVANSGKISDFKESDETSTQAIELFEDVEVYNLDEHGNRIVLSTEYLTLDTQLETLATSELVKLVTDSVQLSSFGMFADLKLDEIVFLRDIRGHYEQPKIQD